MKDRIEIEKDMIPYSFEIMLGEEIFELEINYNKKGDLFTITLMKDGEILAYNEPIVYGVPLFQDVLNIKNFPCLDIVPIDESRQENKVTYENFNQTVFLCIDDEEE